MMFPVSPHSSPLRAPVAEYVTNTSPAQRSFALVTEGTGSFYDFSSVELWWPGRLKSRVPFRIEIAGSDGGREPPPDLRLPSTHLDNIRQVLKPNVADLATAFGVSRQAIYKWIDGTATPEPRNLERIVVLSRAADAFRGAGLARAPALLKMKAFGGRSLLDLVAAGQLTPSHVQALIDEARTMDAAYERSGLARSKAKPTDDWRAEVSIPGVPER